MSMKNQADVNVIPDSNEVAIPSDPFFNQIKQIGALKTSGGLDCTVYVVDFSQSKGERMVLEISRTTNTWKKCR